MYTRNLSCGQIQHLCFIAVYTNGYFSKWMCMFGLVYGLGWYSGTHESIILTLKKTPEQIWLVRAFFHSSNHRRQPSFLSDLHTAAPHIVTRPWPNWFLFSFNIPLELPFLSAPLLEQNFKKEETGGGKNARLRTLRGSTKVCGEETKRSSALRLPKGQNNKCRLSWGSLHGQRGQNVTFWQRRTLMAW